MTQVYDNGMVAHVWAHATQESARSHNGNFWFEGDTIYSYSTPLARIVPSLDGRVALRTNETFSITTSGKHEPAISRALDYGRYIKDFHVPSIGASGGRISGSTEINHAENLAYLVSMYEGAKTRARRQKDLWQPLAEMLQRPADTVFDYAAAFGLVQPSIDVAKDATEITEFRTARDAKNNTPVAAAKREKERVARERRKIEKERIEALGKFERESEMRARWLDGSSIWGNTLRTANGGALLRVKGDNLETSLSASVPLAHAVKAFRFIKRVRETGQPWSRNGHTIRVGHFQVDRIAANGDFHAGCHFIEWCEVERIAKQIGVFDEPASAEALESSNHAA